MEFAREKRLQGGPKDRELDDDLASQLLEEHQSARPGKSTLIEQQLTQGLAVTASAMGVAGRRTLIEQDSQPPPTAPHASITYPAMAPLAGPRSAFDDFRSRGLHEIVEALTSMGCGRGLVQATLSAASKATRPALRSLTARPAPPDPAGQAMWRAAERRAATLYRRAADSGDVKTEDPAVEMALARTGGGQPLPEAVRRKMELEFGITLDRVRIHTDSVAAGAAHAVRAQAFTVGEDIFFADGSYAPETPEGQKLLAHELTHVLQAYQGRTETGGTGIKVSGPDESIEREADGVADRIGGQRAVSQAAPKPAPAISTSAAHAHVMRKAAPPGRTFGEPSVPVGKIGRVQAPNGVFLRVRPAPDAESPTAPIPFNALVYVESRSTQSKASQRWCYVVATEVGGAGFCEERYLAIDPPEPTAKLRPTKPRERLAEIAQEAYGPAKGEDNSRLYVQALYIANRDRAGVKLDHVDLGFKDRALRGEDEEETLKIYKGATVIEGTSIWIPSKEFIERLKAEGAVTGGSTYVTQAWDKAKDFGSDVVEGAKYAAGFVVGLLEGAYNAIVDLFKGAVEMIEAVLEVVWHLVTGNPGRIKDMLMRWVDKMKDAWKHREDIADEFLKRWNAKSMWDRGLFQGEVLGWLTMTVLLIVLTMGETAPAAIAGIAARWPQLIKLIKMVDTLGDVTTYLGAATNAVKLPAGAVAVVAGKMGRAKRVAGDVVEDVGKDAGRAGKKALQAETPHLETLPEAGQTPRGKPGRPRKQRTSEQEPEQPKSPDKTTAEHPKPGPDTKRRPKPEGQRYDGPWPPPKAGPRPPNGTPEAAAWRWRRYVYEQYLDGKHTREVFNEAEYLRRGYGTAADEGRRPGRAGGPKQQNAKKMIREEEGYDINETTRLGERPKTRGEAGETRRNDVDGVKKNAKGGLDYVEVDHIGQRGRPSAAYRIKLAHEIKALGPNDTLTLVDSKDPTRRITYTAQDIPNADKVVEIRAAAPLQRAKPTPKTPRSHETTTPQETSKMPEAPDLKLTEPEAPE